MKITIIGAAGSVGAPAAFYLAARGLADEILMIGGKRQNVLKQHAMDISTAVSGMGVKIRAGGYEDMGGSDIVINSAGVQQGLIKDRMEMLPKNISLIRDIAGEVKKHCPDAFFITASNPVDPLNYTVYKSAGFDRHQIIGYSVNDTFRFREMVAAEYNVEPGQVEGVVIGEHGSTQVLLFSTVKIDGKPVEIDESTKQRIREEVPNILKRYEELQAGRTAGWTCAMGFARIVNAVINDTKEVIPCSVVLDGEYGQQDLSMSVPAVLGKGGVKDIIEYELAPDEQEGLKTTTETLNKAKKIVDEALSQ
ncbi:MAG: malate dehydrogenase [Desulfobacteraceae bacterium]|nr:malate dehydrogenase [Desulfobacteraceae bacterium]